MSTSVRYFHWQMPGAPELTRTQGSLIAILDACLVNGFNLRPVTTLVVDAGVATVTTATAHGYEVDTVVRISGASPAGLNGDHRVLSATSTTFTFATAQPNGTASGSIEARLAPAGWEKPFSGTNIGVYRSPNPESTRFFLRVDDSGVALTDARVVGFESMTDANTGTNAFPTTTQLSGGAFWPKADWGEASTPRAWVIIADDRTFYYWCHTMTNTSTHGRAGAVQGFGDFTPLNSADAFACYLAGYPSVIGGSSGTQPPLGGESGLVWIARSHTGFAGAEAHQTRPLAARNVSTSSISGASGFGPFPNPADNSLILAPAVFTSSNMGLRGYARGLWWVCNAVAAANFTTRTKVDGVGPLTGKRFMSLKDSAPSTGGGVAPCVFVDIKGPWE